MPERLRVELRVSLPRAVHRKLAEVGTEIGLDPAGIVREVVTRWACRQQKR